MVEQEATDTKPIDMKGREEMVHTPEDYEIHIKGHISESLGTQFEGMQLICTPEGKTVLTGQLDQSGLHGVLNRIRNLGLTLLAVNQKGETP
jgi:hypothetical protein